ncbi:MAG: outer membrane beta-barrel protein [Gemmatimonas sp.]
MNYSAKAFWLSCALAGTLGTSATAQQQPDSTIKVTFGGFVDTYYAWDFSKPATYDRAFAGGTLYSTQPSRHNEFNVNLAYVDAKLESAKVRGRLALQVGTSVQSNYAGEPTNGLVSGPGLSRFIQEAVAGVQIAPNLWVDAGIFYSHLGMEGWVSRDNPTYSRSLVADYSPYYQSGAKLTWTPSSRVSAQLDVVNGWQNISENNRGKGAGLRVDVTPADGTTFSYYNLFTQEAGTRLRAFNGVGAKYVTGKMSLLGQFDLGYQDGSAEGTIDSGTWYGYTAVAKLAVTSNASLVARVERFDDQDQIIIGTGSYNDTSNAAFRANAFSVGADWQPMVRFLWRNEFRLTQNRDVLFNKANSSQLSKTNGVLVSSFALTF